MREIEWRKEEESDLQGSSLGGFRDRCRRPSACPSIGEAPWGRSRFPGLRTRCISPNACAP